LNVVIAYYWIQQTLASVLTHGYCRGDAEAVEADFGQLFQAGNESYRGMLRSLHSAVIRLRRHPFR